MEKIKKWLRKSNLLIKIRLIGELFNEYKKLSTHLGAIRLMQNKSKLEADITIRFHAIEKGLALPSPRIGFGEKKIEELLKLLSYYKREFKDEHFLNQAYSVLQAYFNFNNKEGHKNLTLYDTFNSLAVEKANQNNYCLGGTIPIMKMNIEATMQFNFENFINCRYSIRDFSDQPVDVNLIYKALEIAKKTPSACNRQPWKIHVFRNKKIKKEILDWQGNRGFTDNIDSAIVISCTLNSYFINEPHQAYVDGGLYAMTLILAFHSLGIGTIPLTLALMSSKLKVVYEKFELKKDEIPVLMIGIGHLKDSFEVAISDRKEIKEYVRFI